MVGMKILSMASMVVAAVIALGASRAWAQNPPPAQPTQSPPAQSAQTPPPAEAAKAPSSLVIYFGSGSAAIDGQGAALLDQAARLYRDGKPILMTLTGGADKTGKPTPNLLLSQRRALAVFDGLVARGIPPERFEVVAKGETEPAVPTANGVAERRNRQVEITWR